MAQDNEYEVLGTDETGLQSVGRNLARTATNVAGTLVGLPGDIVNGLQSAANVATQNLFGYRQFPNEKSVLPTSKGTTQAIRNAASNIVPDQYLEPQSRTEERADDFVNDLVSFLHPLGAGKTKPLLGLAATGLGHAAKYGAEKLGLSEPAQQGVKVGTMLLTSLGAKPNLLKTAQNYYEKAKETLPVGVKLNATPLKEVIKDIGEASRRGGLNTPSKEFLTAQYKRLSKLAKDGKINSEDAYHAILDANELFREGKIPTGAQSYFGKFIDENAKALNTLGKDHSEFLNSFNNGRELYKTVFTSSKANDFIQNIASKATRKFLSPLTGYFFGLPAAIGGTLAGESVKGIANSIDKAARSPAVLKTWSKAIGSSLLEQAGPTSKYINQLDKILAKKFPQQESENEYEVIGNE